MLMGGDRRTRGRGAGRAGLRHQGHQRERRAAARRQARTSTGGPTGCASSCRFRSAKRRSRSGQRRRQALPRRARAAARRRRRLAGNRAAAGRGRSAGRHDDEGHADRLGFDVLGPFATIADAMAAIAMRTFTPPSSTSTSTASWSIRWPISIAARGVPFVFVTGYGADGIDGRFAACSGPAEADRAAAAAKSLRVARYADGQLHRPGAPSFWADAPRGRRRKIRA